MFLIQDTLASFLRKSILAERPVLPRKDPTSPQPEGKAIVTLISFLSHLLATLCPRFVKPDASQWTQN